MVADWRPATADDIDLICDMYAPAAAEQNELREMWHIADGIPEPVAESLVEWLNDTSAQLVVGTIDDVVFGFAMAQIEELLPQSEGERVGVIPYIYVEEEARQVGVAEAMLSGLMDWLIGQGIQRFDAVVSPGHRLAKNFFESAGFKARRITMHRRDG